jgi:anti-sigma factor RsiW
MAGSSRERFLQGSLPPGQAAEVRAHLGTCSTRAALVARVRQQASAM